MDMIATVTRECSGCLSTRVRRKARCSADGHAVCQLVYYGCRRHAFDQKKHTPLGNTTQCSSTLSARALIPPLDLTREQVHLCQAEHGSLCGKWQHLQLRQLGCQRGELSSLSSRQLREHLSAQLGLELCNARAEALHARGDVRQALLLLLQRLARLCLALLQRSQVVARLAQRLPMARKSAAVWV